MKRPRIFDIRSDESQQPKGSYNVSSREVPSQERSKSFLSSLPKRKHLRASRFLSTMALSLIMKAILLCGAAVVVTSQDLLPEDVVREKARLAFQRIDRNGDGSITEDESLANFDDVDTNDDGVWTLREYSGLPSGEPIPDPVKKVFNYYDKLDGNTDGFVQRTEVLPLHRRNDLNGDGVVNLEEITTFFLEKLRKPMSG